MDECARQCIDLTAVHFDCSAGRVRTALAAARAAGVTAVLVAGGDGTVGSIARHLLHSEFTLGVLPAGTGNDFARALEVPLQPVGAVAVIAAGHSLMIDMGEVNGIAFGHAAILGINSQFARDAQLLRRYIGRISYPVALLIAYLRRTPIHFEVIADGRTRSFDALEVAFLNAPLAGGALDLRLQGATIIDGHLHAAVVHDIDPIQVLRDLPKVLRERTMSACGVQTFSLRHGTVKTAVPVPVTVDGEHLTHSPATVRIIPKALQVFVPKSEPPADA